MDGYNATAIFKDYFHEYQIHNLQIKSLESPNCSHGIQWAWQRYGECLTGPAHILGYLIGAVALPLWVFGSFESYKFMSSNPGRGFFLYLFVTLFTNVLALAGSAMSMQIILLILFEVVAVAVDVATLVVVITVMIWTRQSKATSRYMEVDTGPIEQNKARYKAKRLQQRPEVCSFTGFGFTISVILVTLFLAVYCLGTSANSSELDLALVKHGKEADISYKTRELSITGYVLGCVACVLMLAGGAVTLRLQTSQPFINAEGSNRRPVAGEVMLLISDILLVLGTLLQAGGVRLLLSALPWIVQRFLHGSFQIVKFNHFEWQPLEENDTEGDKGDEVLISAYDKDLPRSSESEESKMVELSRQPLCYANRRESNTISSQTSGYPIYPSTSQSRARITSYDATSTTDSELSSQVQDIELYRDRRCSVPKIAVTQAGSSSPSSRRKRLSLTGLRMASISDTSSDFHDQRVRHWVCQHTPEEEFISPPSVTLLTLNLDTTASLPSPNNPDVDGVEVGMPLLLPGPYDGSLSPGGSAGRLGHSPRKNSL